MNSRRKFFKYSLMGTAAITNISAILSSCMPDNRSKSADLIGQDFTVIFQGDSITDAGREKEQELPNNSRSFGNGYAFIAGAALLNKMASGNLTIYNRGISGNKVYQLIDRWQKDCLDLRPDLLSILIGVNDYWHTLRSGYDGTIEGYENDYHKLLQTTLHYLPDVRLVIGEPFALAGGSAVNDSWFPAFDQYRYKAKKIADEYSAIFIPYQEIFETAILYAPATYWSADGVHPSMAGSQLMASAWLKAVGY